MLNKQLKNIKKHKNLLVQIFLSLVLFFCFSTKTFAQTQQGISITPSFIQLDLATDPPTTQIIYTNNTDQAVALHLSAKDFSAIDENGRFDFIQGQDADNYHYSLSSWIHFETSDITLAPHETKNITITIDKNRLTIGGHYASLLTEVIEQTPKHKIAVHAVAATLLFVRTGTGNEHEEANINDVTFFQNFFIFPDKATLRFQNTGNVQLTPYGMLIIKDSFGNTVAQSIFNEASAITLPESIRKYSTDIVTQNKLVLPGMYTATISLHFGKKNKQITNTSQFFTIGNTFLFPVTLLIIAVISFVLLKIMRRKKK